MNCKTCSKWHADSDQVRGYCGEPRADKAGARTVADYACRFFSAKDTSAGQSNIDDVRAEIMRLEAALHFDADAWSRVLADLSTAGRFSALADAQRRMETARSNQPAVGLDTATGQDKTVVSVAIETGEWRHQDWLHSSDGLPDFEEAERRSHLQKGELWCGVCEDWIGKNELRSWSGDDLSHLLCPGCGVDLVEPVSLEA